MRKEITYIADDGTVFETEEDCQNYECSFEDYKHNIVFIRKDGRLLSPDDIYQADFIRFNSNLSFSKKQELVSTIRENFGIDLPNDTDNLYYYDSIACCWLSSSAEIVRLKRKIAYLEKFQNRYVTEVIK